MDLIVQQSVMSNAVCMVVFVTTVSVSSVALIMLVTRAKTAPPCFPAYQFVGMCSLEVQLGSIVLRVSPAFYNS